MKKRTVSLVVLVAVFALLFGVYEIIIHLPKEEENPETTEDSVIMLAEFDSADIVSISYIHEGETAEFEKGTDKWYLKSDVNFPLDTATVSKMATAIASIGAERFVSDLTESSDAEKELSSYGLDDPEFVITVKYADGKAYKYTVGDYNKFNGCNYFRVDNDAKIYMIKNALCGYFDYTVNDLIVLDKMPSFDEEKTVGFELTNGSVLAVTRAEEEEDVKTLYGIFSKIKLSDWKEYYADGDKLAKYGLSPDDKVTFTILVDDSDENGDAESKLDDLGKTGESGKETSENEYTRFSVYFGNVSENEVYMTIEGSTIIYAVEKSLYDGVVTVFDGE